MDPVERGVTVPSSGDDPHGKARMRRAAAVDRTAGRADAGAIRQGAYLTNGVDLFRVAAVVSGSSGPKTIELEDCRTLEMRTYSDAGAAALGLTPVTASAAADSRYSEGSTPVS